MRIGFFVACGLVALALGWKMSHRDESSSESVSKTSTFTRSTSRGELDATIASNRQKVAANSGDGAAAVQLADALMRAARVKGDASLAIEAEHVLRTTVQHSSSDYLARRMLSVQYRTFELRRNAIAAADDFHSHAVRYASRNF